MDDSGVVGGSETVNDLDRHVQQALQRKRAAQYLLFE
jgi:hypothetical protein